MSGSFMSATNTRSPSTASRAVYFACRVPILPVTSGSTTGFPSRSASAAHSIESTTFVYPVQRQRFVESWWTMCRRDGFGFL